MAQTYAAITQSAQSVTTVLGHLDDRTDTLRSSFSGSSAPGSPVEGQWWLDTSGTPYVLKQYADFDGGGAAWNEVCVLTGLSSDMEFAFQQAKEMRVENLAADEGSLAAAKDGMVFYHTGESTLKFVDGTNGDIYTCRAVVNGTTEQRLDIQVGSLLLDVTNPPTAGTKGTTPTVRGWLFDAVNELASFTIRVPSDYAGGTDLDLELSCVLNQAETASDDIDWSGDLVTVADGEDAAKTSTAIVATLTDISTNNADGSMIVCTMVLDHDDASNPIVAGDRMTIELHRTNLTEVTGVILTHVALKYKTDGGVL